MKFMVTWQFREGSLHEALANFSPKTAKHLVSDIGGEIQLIGRWHDLARRRGVAIFECDSSQAISNWILNWNDIADVDLSVVLDDEETWALMETRKESQ